MLGGLVYRGLRCCPYFIKWFFIFNSMEYEYVDCHCHLDHEKFSEDFDTVVSRAKEGGVGMITSGTDMESNVRVLELSKKYDILCTFGVYPFWELGLDRDVDAEISWIREHVNDCVGIGECGMDFKGLSKEGENDKDIELLNLQKEHFSKVIELSKELDLPLVIHSRSAEAACIEMMRDAGCTRVQMHCFHGKKSLIREIAELGWFISIPANITRLDHFKMVVKMVGLDSLLLETDAPYLSKVALTRSEPADIVNTVGVIAEVLEMDVDVVKKKLRENTKKLFRV
jgi:TatD DNase family protein